MMRISQLGDDVVRLCFILFSLKDQAKKWLYNLTIDYVTLWDDFIKVCLKKFYHVHKTALIKKNIMQFKKEPSEVCWKYFKLFKDILVQCAHHGIKNSWQCQIPYNGLDYQTLLETCAKGILAKG